MIRTIDLRYAQTPQEARRRAARDFDGVCVVSGRMRADLGSYGPLDPAHVFGASNFTELAKCIDNILPMGHYYHNGGPHSLDAIPSTNMPARFIWLADHIHEDYRGLVRVRLEKVLRDISPYSRRIANMADELYETLGRLT